MDAQLSNLARERDAVAGVPKQDLDGAELENRPVFSPAWSPSSAGS